MRLVLYTAAHRDAAVVVAAVAVVVPQLLLLLLLLLLPVMHGAADSVYPCTHLYTQNQQPLEELSYIMLLLNVGMYIQDDDNCLPIVRIIVCQLFG